MSTVDKNFISGFSVETDNLEVAPKSWDRTAKIGEITAGETGVL
jgi:hypothetical protein